MDIISRKYIQLNSAASDARSAIMELADMLYEQRVIHSLEKFEQDVLEREDTLTTEVDWGIAIPHAKSSSVETAAIAFSRNKEGFYWSGNSVEKTHMVFLFAVPEFENDTHIELLSAVACALLEESYREKCMNASTPEAMEELLKQAVLISQDE